MLAAVSISMFLSGCSASGTKQSEETMSLTECFNQREEVDQDIAFMQEQRISIEEELASIIDNDGEH